MNINTETAKLPTTLTSRQWRHFVTAPFPPRLTVPERKVLLATMDLLLISSALLIVTMIWHDFRLAATVVVADVKWYITLAVVWWGCATVFDVYDLALSASTTGIMRNAGLATLLATGVYLLIPWLTPPLLARSYAFAFIALSELLVVAWRVIYAQTVYHTAFRRRALVVGTSALAQVLLKESNRSTHSGDATPFRGAGYDVLGLVALDDSTPDGSDGDQDIVGYASQLVSLVWNYNVDEVIVALEDEYATDPKIFTVLLDCCELGVKLRPLVEVYEGLTARLPVEYARGYAGALWDRIDNPSARLYLALRSLMDLLFALVGLLALVLIAPVVALGNALWSPGPLLYHQVRTGKGGRPFVLSKFRSMIVDAETETGAMWSIDNDPRITPIGRWLRKSRLDELPQVLNVLRGEMSMIGPRPERPHFAGKLSHDLPLYRLRNAVKPGLTGWAQIRYQYGSSVEDSRIKLEYDLYYIKHAGAYLDLLITLQTISMILRLKGR